MRMGWRDGKFCNIILSAEGSVFGDLIVVALNVRKKERHSTYMFSCLDANLIQSSLFDTAQTRLPLEKKILIGNDATYMVRTSHVTDHQRLVAPLLEYLL